MGFAVSVVAVVARLIHPAAITTPHLGSIRTRLRTWLYLTGPVVSGADDLASLGPIALEAFSPSATATSVMIAVASAVMIVVASAIVVGVVRRPWRRFWRRELRLPTVPSTAPSAPPPPPPAQAKAAIADTASTTSAKPRAEGAEPSAPARLNPPPPSPPPSPGGGGGKKRRGKGSRRGGGRGQGGSPGQGGGRGHGEEAAPATMPVPVLNPFGAYTSSPAAAEAARSVFRLGVGLLRQAAFHRVASGHEQTAYVLHWDDFVWLLHRADPALEPSQDMHEAAQKFMRPLAAKCRHEGVGHHKPSLGEVSLSVAYHAANPGAPPPFAFKGGYAQQVWYGRSNFGPAEAFRDWVEAGRPASKTGGYGEDEDEAEGSVQGGAAPSDVAAPIGWRADVPRALKVAAVQRSGWANADQLGDNDLQHKFSLLGVAGELQQQQQERQAAAGLPSVQPLWRQQQQQQQQQQQLQRQQQERQAAAALQPSRGAPTGGAAASPERLRRTPQGVLSPGSLAARAAAAPPPKRAQLLS